MSKDGLNGFARLGPATSIFRPETTGKHLGPTASPSSPSLIVLCSWMGAAPKHIAKYTDGYQRLFPDATILLCESTVYGVFFGSDLTAAQDVIKAASQETNNGSMVLHAFSNGGAINSVHMAESYKKKGSDLEFDSVIFDCCPGTADLTTATRAMSYSLPRQFPFPEYGPWVIWFLLLLYMTFYRLSGKEEGLAWMRRCLNQKTLFAPETRRLYLYSAADQLVESKEVHNHAEDARRQGYRTVRELPFTSAPHCNLVKEDSERYWKTVKAHHTGDSSFSW